MKRSTEMWQIWLATIVIAGLLWQCDCKMCGSDSDCPAGYHCEGCFADWNAAVSCTRIRPVNPSSKVGGLPFNKYAWLTTHNSYAITGYPVLTFENQEDSVTSQLNNGVRGLMLDMYDHDDDVWLCHSFDGECFDFTAFRRAIDTLKEIQKFLAANPSEIVTIFIEDYVEAPNGLTRVFTGSGLKKYWFPIAKMPKNGEEWPSVSEMIANNERLVVFTSKRSKEASEGIAYQWKYVVENQYGDDGMKSGSCPNRAESAPMNDRSRSLVLQNHFPTDPNEITACKDNSASLYHSLTDCFNAAGNRWPNFVAVDFYMRSDGGGASEAADKLNGELICGQNSISDCCHACQTHRQNGSRYVHQKCPTSAMKAQVTSMPAP